MKLRPVKGEKVIKALNRLGFRTVRQKGSHVILKHSDGRIIVVPIHKGEKLGRGILNAIIREVGIDKDRFLKVLYNV
ncbi:MAG: type II toxin-antitoxin system HicA family toxin [Candidatus Thorarchaeota archaeon]